MSFLVGDSLAPLNLHCIEQKLPLYDSAIRSMPSSTFGRFNLALSFESTPSLSSHTFLYLVLYAGLESRTNSVSFSNSSPFSCFVKSLA